MSGLPGEGIAAYFGRDHEEIGALLASVVEGDPAGAPARLKELRARLERHIVWEEEVLFPAALQQISVLDRDPVARMRSEHSLIRTGIREALELFGLKDAAGACARLSAVAEILVGHNAREEGLLYEALDRTLSSAERRHMIDLFEASSRSGL